MVLRTIFPFRKYIYYLLSLLAFKKCLLAITAIALQRTRIHENFFLELIIACKEFVKRTWSQNLVIDCHQIVRLQKCLLPFLSLSYKRYTDEKDIIAKIYALEKIASHSISDGMIRKLKPLKKAIKKI